jgi:formylglycine-generating enzyme required for sulfatase activity
MIAAYVAAELELPPTVDEYRIIRMLGSGAMGRVYLAEDTLLDRLVAIKVIVAPESGSARDRLFSEARAAARITHENVAAIYRVAELENRPLLVSEYVRGRTLAELELPLTGDQVVKIARDLARGLAAAHRRGVLHRDLKPANAVLTEDGVTKLLDFGLAELMSKLDAGEKAAIAGTPMYMAPELWRGADPSMRSDVFSMGVMLHQLYTGRFPFESTFGTPRRGPPLGTLAPGDDAALCAVIERCIAIDPLARYAGADALCEALDGLGLQTPAKTALPEGAPYRGLLAFDSAHSAVFFGRRSETLAVEERLRSDRFVLVAGDSGTGKSSLCRAGVLPRLERTTQIATAVLGRSPMTALAIALAPFANESEVTCAEHLTRDPAGFGRTLRARVPDLVLFVDQLEELVTQATSDDASAVAEALHAMLHGHALRLLATARSDFLTRLAALSGLGDDLHAALWLLRPLLRERLVDVVVEPAAALGFVFEAPQMIEQLVAEARVADGGLPLLQFALGELWDARDPDRKVIPASALASMGGVAGALARHADGVLAAMSAADREAARAILLSLVTSEGTRSHRDHEQLVAVATRTTSRPEVVINTLVEGRLLVAQEAESGGRSAYSIAHEALLHDWMTLRGWLGEDIETRAAKQRIERAAQEWDRLGRRDDALWNRRQLAEVQRVDPATLATRELAFLRRARRANLRRRVMRWALVLAVPLLVASGALWLHMRRVWVRDELIANARVLATKARQDGDAFAARRAAAFAAFDRGADAERLWRAVLSEEPRVESAYLTVQEQLERVLQDDPEHDDARHLLADVLFDRAKLAEARGRIEQRDDLVRRLALYGAADRWTAPARITITAEPNQPVTLARYRAVDGRLELSAPQSVGRTPLEITVEPGSVMFVVGTVRAPVLVRPAEVLRLDLAAPPSPPPEGMVYVPAGRFLFGTAGGEDARAYFTTEPLHEVSTGPYFIARHETTYREWIEYLRSLPESERAARSPDVSRQGFTVRLREHGGVYELTLGPDEHPSTARQGERIVFPGRTSRAAQDWSQLPVSAVSFREAQEFAAWLAATERVPGARLCTEYEWERAARGADGRRFPSGPTLAPDDANIDVTYGRVATAFGPDVVGSHLASRSPHGVDDMTGNVWEWTSSHADPAVPVSRGGGFFQADVIARPENRAVDVADRRDANYGVRICASINQGE